MSKSNINAAPALILKKARELFFEFGYHKTSMRQIAKAVGISTWPLYTNFKNKQDIFLAICQEEYDYVIKNFSHAASENDNASNKLKKMILAYKDFHKFEKHYFQIRRVALMPTAGFDLTEDAFKTILKQEIDIYKEIQKVIQEGIDKGEIKSQNAKELTLVFVAMIEGIIFHDDTTIIEHFDENLDSLIDKAIELIQKSLMN